MTFRTPIQKMTFETSSFRLQKNLVPIMRNHSMDTDPENIVKTDFNSIHLEDGTMFSSNRVNNITYYKTQPKKSTELHPLCTQNKQKNL